MSETNLNFMKLSNLTCQLYMLLIDSVGINFKVTVGLDNTNVTITFKNMTTLFSFRNMFRYLGGRGDLKSKNQKFPGRFSGGRGSD